MKSFRDSSFCDVQAVVRFACTNLRFSQIGAADHLWTRLLHRDFPEARLQGLDSPLEIYRDLRNTWRDCVVEELAEFASGQTVRSISLSPDGNTLMTNSHGGDVNFVDVPSRKIINSSSSQGFGWSCHFDGKIGVAGFGDGTAKFYNTNAQVLYSTKSMHFLHGLPCFSSRVRAAIRSHFGRRQCIDWRASAVAQPVPCECQQPGQRQSRRHSDGADRVDDAPPALTVPSMTQSLRVYVRHATYTYCMRVCMCLSFSLCVRCRTINTVDGSEDYVLSGSGA